MPTPLFKNLSLDRLSEVFGYIKAELDKKVTVVSGKGLSTNDYTTTEKNKLSGIASGAEVNVQSDWSEATTSSDAYILNKPTKLSQFTNDSGYTTNIGTVTQVKIGSTAYNPSSGVVSLPDYPTSLPASDVYSWAKAATKPSYAWSEITSRPTKLSDFTNDLKLLYMDNDSGNSASYAQQTEKVSAKFHLVRCNTTGVAVESNSYGGTILTTTWEAGNYSSELFMGMGDHPCLYYRGHNGSSYNSWVKIPFVNSDDASSLLCALPTWTATPTDDTYLLRRDTAGAASYGQVKFSTVWSYINGKISAAGYTKNTGTVTSVKVGSTSYSPSSGVVSLPAYPTVPTKLSQLTNDSGFVTSSGTIALAKEHYNAQTVDLSSLNENTYYPVTGTTLSHYYNGMVHMVVHVALNSGVKPSWSTHNAGFSVLLDILNEGYGWGTTYGDGICLAKTFLHCSSMPCGYSQMTNSSTPVFWCRGGGKYHIYSDHPITWTVRSSTYTVSSQSVSPTTTYPGVTFPNPSTIEANLKSNSATFTGGVQLTGIAEFTNSPTYLLGIEAFASGGDIKWKNVSSVSVGSATTASSCTGNAASATLLFYTHSNEINFRGGAQATCYFNYRNADTDAAATSADITYKFCNYTSSTDKSNVVSGTFTGKYVNVTNELYIGTSSNVLGTASFYQKTSSYRAILSLNATLTANRNIYLPNASGTIALTSDIAISGTTFYSGKSDTAEHNANNALKNGHYYYTSNGPSGATSIDGALYVQSYSDSWVGQIAQDYRQGNLFVRGKNNGTWTAWRKIACLYTYTGTVSGDVLTVTHNLGLGTSYKPMVTIANGSGHCLIVYAIANIATNSFQVDIMNMDSYVPKGASGYSVTIVWTYV